MARRINRKDTVQKNYIYNVSYNIITVIVPLITTPYVSRVLSVESIGVYSYTYSIILYFTAFVALGTKSFAIKRISRENEENVSYIFWETVLLRMICGVLALSVYYPMVLLDSDYTKAAMFQSIYIIAVMFDISWFFQGLENFKVIVLRNFVFKILSCAAIFIFIKEDRDLILYIVLLAGLTFAGNISLWLYLPQCLKKVSIKKLKPFTGIKEILILFIPTLALQIYAAVDQTMLGKLTQDMVDIGYYSQANRIVSAAMTLITSLSIVTLPRVSSYFGSKEYDKIKECMRKSYSFTLLIAIPLSVGLISIGDILIPWYLGSAYYGSIPLLYFLSALIIIVGISDITGFQYLVATDRQGWYAFSVVMGTCTNIVLNYLLIREHGAVGAVISSLTAEAVVLAIQLTLVIGIWKEYSVRDVFGSAWRYLLSALIMFACIYALKKVTSLSGLLGLVIFIPLGALVYFAMVLILKDELTKKFLEQKVLKKLKIGRKAN